MEKKSKNEVSELLKQLEETVEKHSTTDMTAPDSNKNRDDLSTEELLHQLEKNVVGKSSSDLKENKTTDYDISGFEIEMSVEEVEEKADNSPLEEVISTWKQPKEESESTNLSSISDMAPASTGNDEDEEMTAEQEEAVRQRVESFVLETLDPDSDLPIFETITPTEIKDVEEENTELDIGIARTDESERALSISEDIEKDDPDDFIGEGVLSRFFCRNLADNYDSDETLDFDYKDLNDIDINLSLALGSEEELQETLGYSKVRTAKNGFHDPADEIKISSSVYAGDGKEYRSAEQTTTIKQSYKREKKFLYRRFAFTFALTVIVLFFEHIFMTDLVIPYVTDFFAVKWRFYAVSILLACLCMFCSGKRLLSGCSAMFSMRPDSYTPPAFFALLNIIYMAVTCVWYSEEGWPTYNFVLALFLLFSIADEYLRLSRESLTFDIVSDRNPKLSLERFEGEGELKKDGSYLGRHDFFVEKVNFVGNYFSRVGRIPSRLNVFSNGLIYTILLGMVMMFLSAYLFENLYNALQTFFFFIMLGVPMQFMMISTYPFYSLSRGLKKFDSAIISEAVIDEYAKTDTIFLSDDEMFGKHGASIVGLRLYGDIDYHELLYYSFAVFSSLGAPLCHVFDTSTDEIPKAKDVKINAVSIGGLEATVDGSHKILVGNMAFVRSNGFFPKRNLDDERKIENGESFILYITVDNVLSAKIYIKYHVTKRFEKFVNEMCENGIAVGIRSLDPNMSARNIAILREQREPQIQVIHPTANDLVTIGKHSDSSIITGRNSHMIFRILQQCFHIRNIHKKQLIFHIISTVMAAGIVTWLMLTNRFAMVPSLLVAVYHILWTLIEIIYTKSKLK